MTNGEQRPMTPEELHHRLTHIPEEITTINGMTPTADLDRTVHEFESNEELTYAIEYRLKDQPESDPVHRSVHVQLKRNVTAEGVAAMME